MFCSSCGKELVEGSEFCNGCGGKVVAAMERVQSSPALSDKWAWALACVPLASPIVFAVLFAVIHIGNGPFDGIYSEWMNTRISHRTIIAYFLLLAIYTVFLLLDRIELGRNGFNMANWLWFGLPIMPVFVSAYMFMRAAKTSKRYGYAFLWLAMFAVGSFIMSMLLNAELSFSVLGIIL